MKNQDEQDCDDNNRTISDIEKFGWAAIAIERTEYFPSFVYTIGLWQKFKHPELIALGLTPKTLHIALNDAAEIIKSGHALEVEKTYSDFFENGLVEFIKVDNRNISDYFGYAIDFYKTNQFPALQLIWTDRNNKFPWDSDYQEEFKYRQPLLDRNADFKFREEKNCAVFTTSQWLDLKRPILRVTHDINGDWQFLTGDQLGEDIKIVVFEQMILSDPTLNDVFDLDYGESAEREFVGGKWTLHTK
jgi:hypothetical protein